MAENVVGGKVNETEFLKLVETVKVQKERIEQLLEERHQLEITLMAKDNLITFLKKKMKQFENIATATADNVDAGDGNEPVLVDAEIRNKNQSKDIRGNNYQVDLNPADFGPVAAEAGSVIQVATIPLILTGFLRKMKTRDLLQNCRLVSKEWRDLSTSILLKRKNCQVELTRSSGFGEFQLFQVLPNPRSRDLTELTAFLTTSKTFPSAHFIFNGNLKSDGAQDFLSEFASRVKGIKLTGAQTPNFIRKLFLEQIPHVESLELSGVVAIENFNSASRIFPKDSPKDSPAAAPAPQLLSLTFLKLGKGNSPELVKDILEAALNLQECFGIRWREEIEWFRQCNRLYIVKGLKLHPGKDLNQNSFQKSLSMMNILQQMFLAPDQLQLTCLDLNYAHLDCFTDYPENGPAVCSLILKLLTWSQTTLKQLKLTPDPKLHCLIEWSKLELGKVEKLTLEGDLTRYFVHLFPPMGVSKIFPNLHTIHLKNMKKIPTPEQVISFEDHPPISTVKTLIISGARAEMMNVFAPLFPNITSLFINGPRGDFRPEPFPHFACIIWQDMKGLKSLQLEFDCPAAELDVAFTGLEMDTCKIIHTLRGQDAFQMEEIEQFRVHPSILNLTELEHLFLPGGFTENEHSKFNCGKTMTPTFISFKYAFKLMPKLRVYPHTDF